MTYSASAVASAIASSNRHGRKISGREARAIHRILQSPRERTVSQLGDLVGDLLKTQFLKRDITDLRVIALTIRNERLDPALAYRAQEMARYWDERGFHQRGSLLASAFYFLRTRERLA